MKHEVLSPRDIGYNPLKVKVVGSHGTHQTKIPDEENHDMLTISDVHRCFYDVCDD